MQIALMMDQLSISRNLRIGAGQLFNVRVLDPGRTESVINLRLKLLTNGFRLLKVGGLLVYSTCSLTAAQNEDVVEQFLKENASVRVAGDRCCQKLAL